jgi:hypothetical protein
MIRERVARGERLEALEGESPFDDDDDDEAGGAYCDVCDACDVCDVIARAFSAAHEPTNSERVTVCARYGQDEYHSAESEEKRSVYVVYVCVCVRAYGVTCARAERARCPLPCRARRTPPPPPPRRRRRRAARRCLADTRLSWR